MNQVEMICDSQYDQQPDSISESSTRIHTGSSESIFRDENHQNIEKGIRWQERNLIHKNMLRSVRIHFSRKFKTHYCKRRHNITQFKIHDYVKDLFINLEKNKGVNVEFREGKIHISET